MAEEPNMIRRPIVRIGSKFYFGFDEDQFRKEF
ncbi:MAG: hypothetical protein HY650_06695 [Acidobacteria bacterium]|nr:hypothetical protein [Acidobacteriota bacterium]